ncbi:hypothetical protein PV10_02595 [Exophiala mesophila]|uniref:Uncharacterized protein n=1 Tax=Exophiala mesophila TaxID=212818 RepID=A0A0D1ZLQ3_EXOME|nr:uncharacterized protein PV10_02595 [Exophiala mesophila]KIV94874.1 hypothetical protein PV10_02595 [Exophiala mesophila]
MAFRNPQPGSEAIAGASQLTDSFRHILRVGGGYGNVSGPGLFMLRVIISGTVSSVVTGMFGASVGALIWDTATIPFILSACSGFVLGTLGFYRDAVRKSLAALDRYPRLLRMHLDANFPHRDFHTWTIDRFRSQVFRGSWVLQSMLIASWLTATEALDQIRDAEEQAIILPHTQAQVNSVDEGKEN